VPPDAARDAEPLRGLTARPPTVSGKLHAVQRLFRDWSLAARLSIVLVAACLAVFLLILADVHRWTREVIGAHVQREGEALIQAAAARIEVSLVRVEEAPRRLSAGIAAGGLPSRGALERELCASVGERDTAVFGAAAAFEPGVFEGLAAFAPYCYRKGEERPVKDLAQGGYDYAQQRWYTSAARAGLSRWSEPYFDEGGGEVLMATYSVPIRDAGERILGVATADVTLEWLQLLLKEVRVGTSGYAFLVSRTGQVVTHPDPRLAMRTDLATLATERADPGLRRIAEAMRLGLSGQERSLRLTGQPSFVVFRPLQVSGWYLAVVVPEREALADVYALERRLALTGLVGAALIAFVVVTVSRRATRPLGQLTRAAQAVAAGRLDTPLPPVEVRDEVGRLTASFAEMQTALGQYIETVKENAAAGERLESELRVARELQTSLLPRPSELDAERLGCDVFGLVDPARAVGGDLFDVVKRGPDEVAFVVGDVSGKGIPAALYMALTDVHFDAAARQIAAPERVLARVNYALVSEQAANMCVTLVCAVLDTRSGKLAVASAGHPRPVLLPAEGPARFLDGEPGSVVGIAPDLVFPRQDLELQPGDSLVLYTDGVTKSHDERKEAFGDERLLVHLSALAGRDPRSVCQGLREAVRAHAGRAEQVDDIAILAVRRTLAAHVAASAYELPPVLDALPRCREWLQAWCTAHGVEAAAGEDIGVAVEGLVSVVIRHGYPQGGPGSIAVQVQLAGPAVRLEIGERGPEFDPTHPRDPAHAAEVAAVLGRMDSVEYVREAGTNRVRLERRLDR
jgi:sigma-B regulation protein RsbU (phosphoserine phosphatase)